jgi:hypothetical protein
MTPRSVISRVLPAAGLTLAIAAAAAIGPAPAFAAHDNSSTDGWEVVETKIAGDSFEKMLINRGIPWGPTRVDAWCPKEFPYLDGTQGTPGKSVGKGLIVSLGNDVTIVEEFGGRTWETEGSINRFTGNTVVPWNHWAFADRHVSVKMFCTSSKTKAWSELSG